jgi:hypothetical protein
LSVFEDNVGEDGLFPSPLMKETFIVRVIKLALLPIQKY